MCVCVTVLQVRKLIHQTSPKFTFATLLAKSHGDKTKIAHLADLLEKVSGTCVCVRV